MYAWLCAIGKNLWLDNLRRCRHLAEVDEDTLQSLSDPAPLPEDEVSAHLQKAALRKAIAELPEDYRDLMILHVYGEIPFREIAAQKGKSESWAKVTYYRGKRMLMQKMEELT